MVEDNIQDKKKQHKVEEVVRQFAQKVADMDIQSNIALNDKQAKFLKQIHVLAINRTLSVPEVLRDPRKISYYANDELKLGLCAILMTHVLTNHLSKAKYTEEFFLNHIFVYTNKEGTVKHVDFNETEERVVHSALCEEVVYDWLLYRAPGSRGIRALSDEKTFAQGLKSFASGLSPISEFSRFERKYFEEKLKKTKENKESAQKTFRNSFVKQVAEAAAKQLLATQDPMALAKLLFQGKDYEAEIESLLGGMPIKTEIENLSTNLSEAFALDVKNEESQSKKLDNQELLMIENVSQNKKSR